MRGFVAMADSSTGRLPKTRGGRSRTSRGIQNVICYGTSDATLANRAAVWMRLVQLDPEDDH